MNTQAPSLVEIENEIKYTTSRSGGPGGQSVNKVNTKVTLRWDVKTSESINDEQRNVIFVKLKKVINNEGELVIAAQTSRSQIQNKEEVQRKLELLLFNAFKVKKVRKSTKPTKASNLKRLESKKKQSIKKNLRRGFDD